MECSNCGFKNTDNSKFCKKCGTSLINNQKADTNVSDSNNSPKKKRSILSMIVILLIFYVILVAVVALFYVYTKK